MPAEAYLVPDLNAWVGERGGIMGFGSRRVMGLGLPLLQLLTVSELRAVLAHEFGHYHGGDTRLGPWVYKTRAAIGRTLQGLAHHSDALQLPLPQWEKMLQQEGALLAGLTPESLPARVAALDELARALPDRGGQAASAEERRYRAIWLLGAGLALALARREWRIHALPGEPILLEGPAGGLDPFDMVNALATGQLDADAWQERCAELEITGLPMDGTAPADATPSAASTDRGTGG